MVAELAMDGRQLDCFWPPRENIDSVDGEGRHAKTRSFEAECLTSSKR